MNSYFISDLHLGLQSGVEENQKLARLEKLIAIAGNGPSEFYLVGDILDYWMEFRHVIPKYFSSFLCLLGELSRSSTAVHWFSGNHDFALGQMFTEEYGVHCHYGMKEMLVQGNRFIIGHGDGLDKRDIGYRIFVAMVRNRFNQRLLSGLHQDFSIGLMRYLSRLSRHKKKPSGASESDFLFQYADRLAGEQEFDYFVCGHSHMLRQERLHNGQAEYVNLGTWINGNYPYGIFTGGRFSLQEL